MSIITVVCQFQGKSWPIFDHENTGEARKGGACVQIFRFERFFGDLFGFFQTVGFQFLAYDVIAFFGVSLNYGKAI